MKRVKDNNKNNEKSEFMKDIIKFSVIIPVFNVEKYLQECVDSVLAQSYCNYEVILVDDGSSDNSSQICDNYSVNNKKITAFHKENGGLADARNYGLKNANGEYVVFLDSDDYWEDKDLLKKINDILDKEKSDICVFGMQKLFEETKKVISPDRTVDTNKNLIEELIRNNHFKASACDKVIKKEILTNNSIEFPYGFKSEDIQWTFDILRFVNKVSFLNDNAYVYRQREGSITHKLDSNYVLDILKMVNYALVEAEKCDEEKKYLLLSFIAYEYTVLLGLIASKKCESLPKEIKDKVYDLKDLLRYDLSDKVKKAYKVYRIVGIKITSWVLGIYINIK